MKSIAMPCTWQQYDEVLRQPIKEITGFQLGEDAIPNIVATMGWIIIWPDRIAWSHKAKITSGRSRFGTEIQFDEFSSVAFLDALHGFRRIEAAKPPVDVPGAVMEQAIQLQLLQMHAMGKPQRRYDDWTEEEKSKLHRDVGFLVEAFNGALTAIRKMDSEGKDRSLGIMSWKAHLLDPFQK